MRVYVDSSVVLRHILNGDPALGAAVSSSDQAARVKSW